MEISAFLADTLDISLFEILWLLCLHTRAVNQTESGRLMTRKFGTISDEFEFMTDNFYEQFANFSGQNKAKSFNSIF